MKVPRWRLFPKYATLIIAVVASVLGASSAVSLVFSWREIKSHLVALQAEKAQGAATRIEQYILDIEHQIGWTAFPRVDTTGDALEQRRIEYLKLQRQVPAITELLWIGPDGRERLRVSRLAMDAVNAGTDLSKEPAFVAARGGRTWFGPVQFRKESEPYMAIARPAGGDGGVTVADVNLKFVWDVVSRIKIGAMGQAYVVDATGTLIAHPDISLVLKKTDLKSLPQVAAALGPGAVVSGEARDLAGKEVLAATAGIPALNWTVFVESPRAEAFAPLYDSIVRLALLLVGGLLLAAAASFFLARALVRPIRALQEGTARIGAGELGQRIEVQSGDELEDLAERFNHMSAELQASYAGLERKVEARTRELSDALEQQTATAEILKVISASPTDVQPVFDAIVASCQRLCGGKSVNLLLASGDMVERVASASEGDVTGGADVARWPLDHDSVSGDCILRSVVVPVPDREAVFEVYPRTRELATAIGWRSAVFVPLLRDGKAIGCIGILRSAPGTFDAKEVSLAQVFADQAVIAIENVRLFNETKEALEQQTATAEVLRVISGSVADTAPVFEKILESCSRLFDSSEQGIVLLGGDQLLRLGAHRGSARERLQAMFPVTADDSPEGRALREQRVLHYPDVLRDAPAGSQTQKVAASLGGRTYSQVFAPMRWEGQGVGYLYVTRLPPAPFSDKEIDLLKTFADQAAIAIQNARLFHALEDKSRQLEAANRHKSEFLANMSHELRTPLNAIIGFSEVLTEQMFGDVNDKQMEYLKDIHSSGQHLLSLINDVLDLSKIEAGKMELDLSCFDLGLLLEHSATLVRERAQRHGLMLELDVGEGLEEWVADARKVKQVAVNLLSNAVKFTPNGGRVSVRARHLNGVNGLAGSWAEVCVSDTGVGIAPQDQALVFEEFRQASGDVLRKAEGTGLGLALVKRFVELHGGQITLESEPGRGSTFRFVLPQHEVKVVQ
ncbi:MAG: GAF domain-containing protein [Burkholderiaceae bacterium]|nr:GAF domain-containing protein [Burkholderiaceae bacterium]